MSTTRLFYARAVLFDFNLHDNPQAEQCLVAVFTGEDSTAHWNPGDTTLSIAGATQYNSFGPNGQDHVWNYPTADKGVMATMATMRQSNMAPWLNELHRDGATALSMARAFSRVPWAYVGDVLPLEIVQEYNAQKRSYLADRRNLVAGPGAWTFQSNGAPMPGM